MKVMNKLHFNKKKNLKKKFHFNKECITTITIQILTEPINQNFSAKYFPQGNCT